MRCLDDKTKTSMPRSEHYSCGTKVGAEKKVLAESAHIGPQVVEDAAGEERFAAGKIAGGGTAATDGSG